MMPVLATEATQEEYSWDLGLQNGLFWLSFWGSLGVRLQKWKWSSRVSESSISTLRADPFSTKKQSGFEGAPGPPFFSIQEAKKQTSSEKVPKSSPKRGPKMNPRTTVFDIFCPLGPRWAPEPPQEPPRPPQEPPKPPKSWLFMILGWICYVSFVKSSSKKAIIPPCFSYIFFVESK